MEREGKGWGGRLGAGKERVVIPEAFRRHNVRTPGSYVHLWFMPCWLPERVCGGSPATGLVLPTHTEQFWESERTEALCVITRLVREVKRGLFLLNEVPMDILSTPASRAPDILNSFCWHHQNHCIFQFTEASPSEVNLPKYKTFYKETSVW